MSASGPKVVDFGISHAIEGTALTQTGLLMGSPAWMAPEQAQGRAVTPAADVFAWGTTVAFAATGRSPYGEGKPDALVYRVVHEEPDLHGVDNRLHAVVTEALRKDPTARPSADDLLVHVVKSAMGGPLHGSDVDAMATIALDRTWQLQSPRPSGHPGRPRRLSLRLAAWGVAVVIVLGALAVGDLYVEHSGRGTRHPNAATGLASSHSGSSTVPATTTTSQQGSASTSTEVTTTTFPGFDYSAASLKLQELGYNSDTEAALVSQESGPLYVLTGTCAESATGYCQNAFFFYGNRYLGTDVSAIDIGVSIQWTTRDVAALSYPLYAPEDPHCCPTGGSRTVRFEWNGSRVVPIDPLPLDPNSTTGDSGNSGNTGIGGNSGNSGNS